MRERRSTELLPAINKLHSEHLFNLQFDKKCGDDNDCHTDLSLSAILLNITYVFNFIPFILCSI